MGKGWQFKASCETQRAFCIAYEKALINSLGRVGEN